MAKQIKSKAAINISGVIRSKISQSGLANLTIELWDKDNLKDDYLGKAITDSDGVFTIRLEQKTDGWNLKDRKPDIYFKIFAGDKMIHQTQDDIIWNLANNKSNIEIFIEMEKITNTETTVAFTVRGKVSNAKEEAIKKQALVAFDVDVKGASIYRTVSSLKDLKTNGGFELLHEAKTDNKGNYSFQFFAEQFAKAERKKADIMVYAVSDAGKIIGRSKLVNTEDYTNEREVNNEDIILEKTEEKTEYELLLSTLLPFLRESEVPLLDLAKSADQLQFVAKELDKPVQHIQLVITAEELRTEKLNKTTTNQKKSGSKKSVETKSNYEVKNSPLSHELLYAIGRQNISLDWSALYKKTDAELKVAISTSIEQQIIKPYTEQELKNFFKLVHKLSADAILNSTESNQKPTLEKLLSSSLPDQQLQKSFVASFRNFRNEHTGNEVIDYKKFWNEYLPKTKEFKGKPAIIEKIQFTQKLIAISGAYQPLIDAINKEKKVNTIKDLVGLPEDKLQSIIAKTGVPPYIKGETEEEKVANYNNQIQAVLYATYPTPKIQQLVKQKELPISNSHVARGIENFLTSNEVFDFKVSNVDAFYRQIKEAAPNHVEAVKTELKTIQRVYQVSPAPSAMKVLIENKLTSAYSIANMPKKSFMQMHGEALGGEKMAEAVYQRAEHISTLATERSMVIHEMAYAEAPELVYSKTDYAEVMEVMKSKFPNYANLFGSPDICECEHCRSVYSAAAYMVDLLRFLEKSKKNDDGKTPLDMFELRRPDILALPLTCENTNTIIPYIDLVNEVMEFYTVNNTLTVNAAHDTGTTTAAELRANPQYVEKEAYRKLSKEVYPFTLPYHQPLDIIRTYGKRLGIERHEAMLAISGTSNSAIQAETLQLSNEEFTILTKQDLDGNPDSRLIHEFFGYTSASDLENMAGTNMPNGIHEFLHRAGIHYTDLIELIKTKFINPHQDKLGYIENLFAASSLKSDEIYRIMKQIKSGASNASDNAKLASALDEFNNANPPHLSVSFTDFVQWVQAHFDELDSVITLYQSKSMCDLDTTCLRTIKNIYAPIESSGIDDVQWSRIHRFIRLWRKLGWTMHELDLMLIALGETDITPTTIEKLSYVVLLNNELKLPINKLSVIWGDIDTVGNKSLYQKLFLSKAIQKMDNAFLPDNQGKYFSNAESLINHKSAICAAFQISDADLTVIINHIAVSMPGLSDLSMQYLSVIYRYVVLSKSLQIKISHCCKLITLFNINPFSVPSGLTYIDIFPSKTLEFFKLCQNINTSKFKTETLEYIFTGTDSNEASIGIKEEKLSSLTKDVVDAFNEIDANYPLVPKEPVTKDQLSNLLAKVYQADKVKILIGILGFTQAGLVEIDCPSFKVTVASSVKPSVVIPKTLNSKYSYNITTGIITCLGIMSDAEKTILQGLSSKTTFKKAVNDLYHSPQKFIHDNFLEIELSANSAIPNNTNISLLNHPTLTTEKTVLEKLEFLYKYYIPILRKKLQEDIIIQKTSLATGLGEETTFLLIKDFLDGFISSTAPINTNFESLCKTVHRAALFILGFKLSDKEIKHFIQYNADFENIDFNSLLPSHWTKMNQYVQLRNQLPQTQLSLIDLFAQVYSSASTVPILTHILQSISNWNANQLNSLVASFAMTKLEFKNVDKLEKLHSVLAILSKTGISEQFLLIIADMDTGYEKLHATAVEIKTVLKAKYVESEWLKLVGELNNHIRENQKQALISHLLTNQNLINWGVNDTDGLFEYFLIDVQMGACMDTSRIVQANAAIQMYVQRCLLNLENKKVGTLQKGVSPDAIDRNRWEWMKLYQVWVANRKVFLYPENWLEPEWRDDRSPFFKELESELTQNDINPRNVETALRNYLTKMDTVANLDVCGMYQENDDKGIMEKLHVFGRTHNAPYQFFYRTCSKFYKWSAWEKVPVDIRMVEDGENSGVHLVPVVWKNRLFIFWPEFIEKQQENSNNAGTPIKDLANQTSSSLKSRKYWEMRLAWSENTDGKWEPKQLSKEFTRIEDWFKLANTETLSDAVKKITIKSDIANETLRLIIEFRDLYEGYRNSGVHFWLQAFFFKLVDIHAKIEQINFKDYSSTIDGISVLEFMANESGGRYETNFEKHELDSGLHLFGTSYLSTPMKHNLMFSNNLLEKESAPLDPFFYSDKERTYFVKKTYSDLESLKQFVMENSDSSNIWSFLIYAMLGSSILEFHTFYNPYSSQFVTNLNRGGIKELMNSDTLKDSTIKLKYNDDGNTFVSNYNPSLASGIVKQAPVSENYKLGERYTYYKENICFDVFGANSIYNWELFFHAPLYIATRLSKNGKYEEAMKWFHYIFDPTTDEVPATGESETSRYWKTLPFKTTASENMEEWFIRLTSNQLSETEVATIAEWRDNPFKPFVVARNRPIAFMKNVVLKYVENIRLWGDSLFRAFTRESVNEALQLYVIANHILGPRPEFVPKRGEVKAETYNSLKSKLDDFSNALVEMENAFPFSSAVPSTSTSPGPSLLGMGQSLYFCIPSNEKLMEHGDIIADRLFKIRHCMDIDGNERQLALFSPPIDPAALINAASQGISLADILSDISSPPPIYRFSYLLQKANEFCNDVKSLGGALLSAIEKKDGEELGRIRATHELNMLDLMTGIKERQILDAKVSKEGLLKSRETAALRLEYYNSLLSSEGIDVPTPPNIEADLDIDSQLPADTNIAKIKTDVDVKLVDVKENGVKVIPKEKEDLVLSEAAKWVNTYVSAAEQISSLFGLIPQFDADGKPMGVGVGTGFGGVQLSKASSKIASSIGWSGAFLSAQASAAQKMAGYIRREQEWTLQANLAAREIIQLDKQIVSADIKIQISQKELSNHKKQIENSKQVEQYLKDKFSNEELYQWMKEQLFSVYKESYNMAFDMAKKAEKCYKYELGKDNSNFISYGHWDNSKQGLCSGEKLQLSLRQLEKAYIEENKREYELTKHVSLNMLDPLALIKLRATGVCDFDIPEVLYDMDHAGHYFRRIKSVSISLPCIAGPYTSVSAKLSLVNNKYRKNTDGLDDYAEIPDNDGNRFVYNIGATQSIAASSAQNDSGVFELNFRDERYLPFEGTGAISSWRLELPTEIRQFDYNTIADVVIHLKYTAREGGSTLKTAANNSLKERLALIKQQLGEKGLHIAINMKHDMPNEWHMLMKQFSVDLKIDKSRLPYMVQNLDSIIESVIFVSKLKDITKPFSLTAPIVPLVKNSAWNILVGQNSTIVLDTNFSLSATEASLSNLEELIMVIKYKINS